MWFNIFRRQSTEEEGHKRIEIHQESHTDCSPLTIELIQQINPSHQPTISVSIKMTIQNGSTTAIRNAGRATIASRIRGSKSRMERTTSEIGQEDANKIKAIDSLKKFQRIEQIPSLKDFMHTQKVKTQYRNFLRAQQYTYFVVTPDRFFHVENESSRASTSTSVSYLNTQYLQESFHRQIWISGIVV